MLAVSKTANSPLLALLSFPYRRSPLLRPSCVACPRAIRLFRRRTHVSVARRFNPLVRAKTSSVPLAPTVLVGLAIGGVLLLASVLRPVHERRDTPSESYTSPDTPESHLVMAPDTPPGRPGTLTAEQEAKLRELWAATLKVFGVFEPVSPPANGTPKVASTPSDPSDSTAKKEKKRSRLSVFRRHKDKDGEADSPSASGATTSADSSLILPGGADDDDDKHGQAKEFKAAIASIAPRDLRDAFWSMAKHDHPDALLLRFLRARKWDPEKALIMLISTMHWRAQEMHVDDDIVRRGEAGMLEDSNSADPQRQKEGADFLAQMRMGKSFLHGTDNEGRPMCVVRVRLHRQGEQSEQSLERFTVYTIETARMMLRPPVDTAVSSRRLGGLALTRVGQTIVFDMTNFSMANMVRLRRRCLGS